jgi:hypothetical protein
LPDRRAYARWRSNRGEFTAPSWRYLLEARERIKFLRMCVDHVLWGDASSRIAGHGSAGPMPRAWLVTAPPTAPATAATPRSVRWLRQRQLRKSHELRVRNALSAKNTMRDCLPALVRDTAFFLV